MQNFPGPGIEPAPPAVEARSLNPWTTREVPDHLIFNQVLHLLPSPGVTSDIRGLPSARVLLGLPRTPLCFFC